MGCSWYSMPIVYERSAKLKEIIGRHRWHLYDTTSLEGKSAYQRWDALHKKGPAEYFQIGHHYLLIPSLQEDETCLAAYQRMGRLPSLQLPDEEIERPGMICERGIRSSDNTKLFLFSRLYFKENNLTATSPSELFGDASMRSPIISMPYSRVIPIFEDHFAITTIEDIKRYLSVLDKKTVFN